MARVATGESVLSRAVRVFEAFTPDEKVLSVAEIARRARLHPATASRCCSWNGCPRRAL
jgi:DNA-binding IclR family transcriptional regulator